MTWTIYRQKAFFEQASAELLRRQRLVWLAGVAVILNVMDLCISLHLFRAFDGLQEANPILRYALSFGTVHFVALKLIMSCTGIWVLYETAKRGSTVAEKGLIFCSFVLFLVVMSSMLFLLFTSVYGIAK